LTLPANIIDLLEVGIKPVDLGHLHQLAKAYGQGGQNYPDMKKAPQQRG